MQRKNILERLNDLIQKCNDILSGTESEANSDVQISDLSRLMASGIATVHDIANKTSPYATTLQLAIDTNYASKPETIIPHLLGVLTALRDDIVDNHFHPNC